VAGTATPAAKRAKRRPAATRSRRRLRLLWLIAFVLLTTWLYYRPLASYLEARNDLAASRAEVQTLQVVRDELELRLANSTSLEATQREARRIGYVLPGEQLFVVKGIPAWRRAHSARPGR
jgi:ferric-dicitrate binding protein FerR (iron transport regulator)